MLTVVHAYFLLYMRTLCSRVASDLERKVVTEFLTKLFECRFNETIPMLFHVRRVFSARSHNFK